MSFTLPADVALADTGKKEEVEEEEGEEEGTEAEAL